jgi:hypothetical protein
MKGQNDNNKPIDLTDSFSVEKLEIQTGTLTKKLENGSYTILLPIKSFIFEGEIVNTTLWFDNVLLHEPLENYLGMVVSFPINPNEGYIDGSTYIGGAHNPVDIHTIKFIKIENKRVDIELRMDFVFEYEGTGLKNETLIKEVSLIIE